MNKTSIKPIKFWTPQGDKEADKLVVYNFHNYNFDGSPSSVNYVLGETIMSPNPEGEDTERFFALTSGTVQLPDSLVQTWGSDDKPIISFVLSELKLEEAD